MPTSISQWLAAEVPDGPVRMDDMDRVRVRNDPFFFLSQGSLAKRNGFPKPIHVLFANGKPCDKWITPAQ